MKKTVEKGDMMKAFLMGMVVMLTIIVFMGASGNAGEIGRYQLGTDGGRLFIVDTKTGVTKKVRSSFVKQLGIPFSEMAAGE